MARTHGGDGGRHDVLVKSGALPQRTSEQADQSPQLVEVERLAVGGGGRETFGPRWAPRFGWIGEAMWTNGSGTNSVKPPVSRCSSRVRSRCRAQGTGCSTAPNIIVTFERSPTEWAMRWASNDPPVSILSRQRIAGRDHRDLGGRPRD